MKIYTNIQKAKHVDFASKSFQWIKIILIAFPRSTPCRCANGMSIGSILVLMFLRILNDF